MNRIRLLSEQVANQIAAGEVVERPASVVKELVENSLDADAKKITVEIGAGGRSLIRVTDDGTGMSRDDALLCLERHATSKIQKAEDLTFIATMGFRGEAVPSIASVSRFTLTTRERDNASPEGTQIIVNGGTLAEVKAAGSAPGTSFEVRQLFYNLPARRKFLRTEETEAAHIQHYLTLAALAFPEVAFTFQKDGRNVWQLPAVKSERAISSRIEALRERLRALLGDEKLLPVNFSAALDGDDSLPDEITTTSAGTRYFLPTTIRDRMIVFLDGQRLPESQVTTKSAELDLTPGEHSVAILAAHYGRDKLVGYSGPIDTVDAKGLGAPVVLAVSLPTNLTQWQALPVVQTKPDTTTSPSPTDPGWRNVDQRTDVFNNSPGWAWYQTIVNAADSGTASTPLKVHFDRVDDNGTVFCNGKLVGTHVGYNTDFAVDVTSAWIPGQENVISVLDENTGGGGGISGTVTLSPLVSDTLSNWSMRGGIGDPGTITGWTTATAQAGTPAPAFYKAKFIDIPPAELGPYPILRVNLAGMSAGVVWLNGHNLGRYPEKIPVDGLYLPECWLNKGVNTLTIFDEDGEMPDKVDLYVESAASRYGYKVSN